MTKIGHQVTATAFSVAFCYFHQVDIVFSLIIVIATFLGSTAPDYLEFSSYDFKTKRRYSLIPHRTITHSFWIWLIILFFIFEIQNYVLNNFEYKNLIFTFFYSYILSSIFHIFVDMFSKSGIPLFSPFGKKFGFKVYHTGKKSDFFFAIFIIFFSIFINYLSQKIF